MTPEKYLEIVSEEESGKAQTMIARAIRAARWDPSQAGIAVKVLLESICPGCILHRKMPPDRLQKGSIAKLIKADASRLQVKMWPQYRRAVGRHTR